MLCAAFVILVIVLLSVVVIPPVRLLAVRVVVVVRVPGVTVCVTGTGVMSAPFPPVGSWDADVDRLGLCRGRTSIQQSPH